MEKETSFFAKLISYGPGRRTAQIVVKSPHPQGGMKNGKPRMASRTVNVESATGNGPWHDRDGIVYLF